VLLVIYDIMNEAGDKTESIVSIYKYKCTCTMYMYLWWSSRMWHAQYQIIVN